MPDQTPAAKFIAAAVNHPEWLRVIEAGQPGAVVAVARENGFDCSLEDLKGAARELIAGNGAQAGRGSPSEAQIDEAASGLSDLENDTGYGDDTGYAALYGVAGVILKMTNDE